MSHPCIFAVSACSRLRCSGSSLPRQLRRFITIGGFDQTWSSSISNHFTMNRISAAFTDLNPSGAGAVRYKVSAMKNDESDQLAPPNQGRSKRWSSSRLFICHLSAYIHLTGAAEIPASPQDATTPAMDGFVTVWFDEVRSFGSATELYSFQVKIFQSGKITVMYQLLPNTGTTVVVVSDRRGPDRLSLRVAPQTSRESDPARFCR